MSKIKDKIDILKLYKLTPASGTLCRFLLQCSCWLELIVNARFIAEPAVGLG
jgi:putative component of membrane protein insertase Oxa1/YidC/SpoIIIJ protein YidD